MKRRIGLLAQLGAAVVALACLLASQALVPVAALAKHPEIGIICNGDPEDGNRRQFTDPVPTPDAAQPPMTAATPVEPDDRPSVSTDQRSESIARLAWRVLAYRLVHQALWLALKP